jgi:hypothetical protein
MAIRDGRHASRHDQRQVTVPEQRRVPEAERVPEAARVPETERVPEPARVPEAARVPEGGRDRLGAPEGAILEGTVAPAPRRPARQARQRGRGLALAWIAAAMMARAVRDPRFAATVITGVIAVLAVSNMGKADFLSAMRRLSAWDARTLHKLEQDLEKGLHRQGKT